MDWNLKHMLGACSLNTVYFSLSLMHLYMHAYKYTLIHAYIHHDTYIHTYTHAYIYTCIHTLTYIDDYIHARVRIHTCTNV